MIHLMITHGKVKLIPGTWQYKILRQIWRFAGVLWYTLHEAVRNWLNVHAAACTYYFLVALVPILVLTGWSVAHILPEYEMTTIFTNIAFYEQIQEFARSMKVMPMVSLTMVGFFGALYGLWSAAALIRSISIAFMVIFDAKNVKKKLLIAIGTYVFIPFFLVAAILFAFLANALVQLMQWVMADTLRLVTAQMLNAIAAAAVTTAFIVLATFASFMLLSPKRLKSAVALKGALLFGIYFLILQNSMTEIMSGFITKHYIYGALGSILLVLLWIFLIFLGLFLVAQYTSVLNNFEQLNHYRYIYTRLKDKASLIESVMMEKLPFADDEYLTHFKKSEMKDLSTPQATLIIVRKGKVAIRKSDGAKTLEAGGRMLLPPGENQISAIKDSYFVIIPEEILSRLFKHHPEIWDHIELQTLNAE